MGVIDLAEFAAAVASDGPVTIAGPTCDSADVLYEKSDYELPLALRAGDRIEILSTGAYTTTYSAVAYLDDKGKTQIARSTERIRIFLQDRNRLAQELHQCRAAAPAGEAARQEWLRRIPARL